MAKTTRRNVIGALAALLQGLGTFSSLDAACACAEAAHAFKRIRFGVQLNAFPVDPNRFQTFVDTLDQVNHLGYDGFESGFRYVNQQFAEPAQARRKIEQSGLTFFGIHIFFPDSMYDPATRIAAPAVYEPVARGGAALGAKHLILSGAPATDPDQLKSKIDALNAAGRFVRSAGITAAYHNHWWEFESKIGEIEALYSQTDPALVHLCARRRSRLSRWS